MKISNIEILHAFTAFLRNFSNQWLQYCSRQFSGRLIEGEHQSGAWHGETLPSGNVVKQFSYVDTWNVRRFLRRYWTTWKYPTGAGRERRGECCGQSAWSEKSFRSWWLDLWQTWQTWHILHINGAEWWRYHGIRVFFFKIWLDGNDRVDGVWGYIQRRQALHKAIQEAQVVCCTAVSAGSGLLKEIQFPLETGFKILGNFGENHTILWGKLIFFGDPWGQMMHLPPPSDISYPPNPPTSWGTYWWSITSNRTSNIGSYLSWLQTVGALWRSLSIAPNSQEWQRALKCTENLPLWTFGLEWSTANHVEYSVPWAAKELQRLGISWSTNYCIYNEHIFQYISSFKDHFQSTSMLMNLIFVLKGSRWSFFKHALFVAIGQISSHLRFGFRELRFPGFFFCLPSGCFQK